MNPNRTAKEKAVMSKSLVAARRLLAFNLKRLASVSVLGAALATVATTQADSNTSGVPIPPAPAYNKADAAVYGKQLAYYADDLDRGWVDQYSSSTMTLIDGKGDKVSRETRQMLLEGKGGDKSISRFMSPPDIRGVAALIHEHQGGTDDSWLYLPSSRRTRRISGANRTSSFQGTEFTYEDLSGFDATRYKWKYLADDSVQVDGGSQKVFKLEAIPSYKDTGYSKLTVHLNQKSYRVEKIEYFDLASRALKVLTFSKWEEFHGRYWRARKLEMKNLQTGKRTLLEMNTLLVNLSLYKRKDGSGRDNLKDDDFTRRALEQG